MQREAGEDAVQGYQLTFFTQQDHQHRGKTLAHWLVEEARAMGIGGATLVAASEGFGHHRRIHSAHFIELADQPLEVVMAVTAEEADRLFTKLRAEKVKLFYTKSPVEFGTTGGEE
jgi:PII-like signaling protein